MISAVFQIPGNVEDEREALMIDVTKGSIIGRQSLMTRVGTLSIPGAENAVLPCSSPSPFSRFQCFRKKLNKI